MIRGYEEQFEGKTVDDIRNLIARIELLTFPSGVSRYYAVDLSLCLQGGALLGALQVAASLLEIFVREIVIERSSEAYSESEKKVGMLQRQLEQMRHLGFKKLADELYNSGMWSKAEAESAKQFYDDVRIPIHHGLPARFVKNFDIYKSVIMEGLFGYAFQISHRDFEEVSLSQKGLTRFCHDAASFFTDAFVSPIPPHPKPAYGYLNHRRGDR